MDRYAYHDRWILRMRIDMYFDIVMLFLVPRMYSTSAGNALCYIDTIDQYFFVQLL
jgi:hypothetical protein